MADFNWRRQPWLRKIRKQGTEGARVSAKVSLKSIRRRKRKPAGFNLFVKAKPQPKPLKPAEHAFDKLAPADPHAQLPGVSLTRPPWK